MLKQSTSAPRSGSHFTSAQDGAQKVSAPVPARPAARSFNLPDISLPDLGEPVPAPEEKHSRPQVPRIAGASGEFAAVASRVARPAPLSEEAAYYSRYNKRYTNPERAVSGLGIDVIVRTTIAEPAYVWPPFLTYAAASVAAALVWCLVCVLTDASSSGATGTFMVLGLAILCIIVFAGIVLAVATTVVSLQRDERLIASDVLAAAVGKTALMMVVSLLAWVLSMAVAMM